MKKILLAAALLFMGCATLQAQYKLENLNISYGEELPEDKQKLVHFIGEANGKIYGIGVRKDDYFLKIFESGSMKLLACKQIILPDLNDREVEFEDVYLFNGKLYAIGSVYNKKEKVYNLVGTPLGEDGNLSKDGVILFKVPVEKKSERGNFYFRTTQDKSGLLVMHAVKLKKEDAVKYEVKLFDDNLATIFNTVEKVVYDDDHKDYEFYIADFDVALNDDVFLVINEGWRDKKKKERVERFEVHAYKSANSYKKEVINIGVTDKSLINCQIVPSGNILHLMGFYSGVTDSGRVNAELKGVYAANINLTTNQPELVKFNDFDMATKVKLIGERRAKKGKEVPPLYNITSIIGREDGGVIMLSEYQTVQAGGTTGIGFGGVGVGATTTIYNKNEIIVTSLAADGTHEWSNVIPKLQAAAVTTFSAGLGFGAYGNSFSVGGVISVPFAQMSSSGAEFIGAVPIYRNGMLSVLINDNIKNKGVTDIEKIKGMGSTNKLVPSLFVFDKKGNITRKDPDEVIKDELILRPGVVYRSDDSNYIIYASKKDKDKLGRMTIPK